MARLSTAEAQEQLARVVSALEELGCGECEQAAALLADLQVDLAAIVEQPRHADGSPGNAT